MTPGFCVHITNGFCDGLFWTLPVYGPVAPTYSYTGQLAQNESKEF